MSQARLVPHSMGLMVLRTSGHVPHARRTMHTDDVDEKGSAAQYARFQAGLLMRHCWHHLRYTPDGKWILFTAVTPRSRSLWIMSAEGGEPIVIAQGGIYMHGVWQPQPSKT